MNRADQMFTPEGVLLQFESIGNIMAQVELEGGPIASAEVADAFCVRMCRGIALEALAKTKGFTAKMAPLMMTCLEFLTGKAHASKAIDNLIREMASMEINTAYGQMLQRKFMWTDRGPRMANEDRLPAAAEKGTKINLWQAVAVVPRGEPKTKLEAPNTDCDIYEYKMPGTAMTVFYWQILLKGTNRIGFGHEETLEKAAEALMRRYMKAVTQSKLFEASTPRKGTTLVVMGNWITNEEYMSYPNKANLLIMTDANEDDREHDNIFALSYPKLGKDKARVHAHRVEKASSTQDLSQDNCIITLRFGFQLNPTMDWYVYKPENAIVGEFACNYCGTPGNVSGLNAMACRGRGLLCGACIEHFSDIDQLDEDQFDHNLTVV